MGSMVELLILVVIIACVSIKNSREEQHVRMDRATYSNGNRMWLTIPGKKPQPVRCAGLPADDELRKHFAMVHDRDSGAEGKDYMVPKAYLREAHSFDKVDWFTA